MSNSPTRWPMDPMPKRVVKVIQGLYPLADLLQMDLILNDRNGKFRLIGEQNFELDVGGVTFEIEPRIIASGVAPNEAWALVRVVGDFCLLAASVDDNKLYVWLLDGPVAQIPIDDGNVAMKYNGLSVTAVSNQMVKGRKAIFTKNRRDEKWECLDAGDLEQRLGKRPEEKRRPADKAGANPAQSS